MRVDILTILPQILESPFADSIMKRAKEKGHVEIHSTPGQGTLVRVDIPLVEESDEQAVP